MDENNVVVIDESNVELWRTGFFGTAERALAYGRWFDMQEGDVHEGHSHYIDHMGILFEGAVEIEWRREDGSREGRMQVLAAPCVIPILADTWHKITALKPTRWLCLFNAKDAEHAYGSADAVPWHLEKERV